MDEVADVLVRGGSYLEMGLPSSRNDASLRELLDRYEAHLIRSALERTEGNVAAAARTLSTDRPNLYRRMKRLGLSPDDGQ